MNLFICTTINVILNIARLVIYVINSFIQKKKLETNIGEQEEEEVERVNQKGKSISVIDV